MTDYKLPSGHDSALCSIFRKCIVVLLVLVKSMCIIPLITVILINVNFKCFWEGKLRVYTLVFE